MELDQYLTDLCQEVAKTSNSPDCARPVVVDGGPLTISNDLAVPLGLIVNELLTNAIQHSRSDGEGQALHVAVSSEPDQFSVSVSDQGAGPDPTQTATGLGSQLVEALVRQLNGTIAKQKLASGYTVTVTVPNK